MRMAAKPEQVDLRPGRYYVSMVDGNRSALLLGPYATHQEALDDVLRGNDMACKIDPRAHWYGFGTCRLDDDYPTTPQGRLNQAEAIE